MYYIPVYINKSAGLPFCPMNNRNFEKVGPILLFFIYKRRSLTLTTCAINFRIGVVPNGIKILFDIHQIKPNSLLLAYFELNHTINLELSSLGRSSAIFSTKTFNKKLSYYHKLIHAKLANELIIASLSAACLFLLK